MYWILLVIVIVIVIVGTWWLRGRSAPLQTAALTVGTAQFTAEIADTIPLRERGLSGRERLEDGYGILFVFGSPAQHAFWMKGMRFALDFVWIRDGRVIGVTENVPPYAEGGSLVPQLYYPPSEADRVLELNAGEIGKGKIKIGDTVSVVH
ncbi:MAG: DUF192 domain-containing protein [Candidatus Liptonbacteria bacterium]|nr:DUF192 domain-containing protein [Candidatus Liptonbacteria bacterium]MBI3114537.1 DUF192 domain-containing protein [Candidatus Harrisonbacteria bacterium]